MNRTLMVVALASSLLLIAAFSAAPIAAQESAQSADKKTKSAPDRFEKLRPWIGTWRGEGEGKSGKAAVQRTYEFVLGGRFLQVRSTSTYAAQPKNPKGETHEELGMYSYDSSRKMIVLRQFHIEGFVNHYALQSVSEDGKELVFITESIESIPAGFRARERLRLSDPNTLVETFEIAEPGKDFEIYVRNTLTRVR